MIRFGPRGQSVMTPSLIVEIHTLPCSFEMTRVGVRRLPAVPLRRCGTHPFHVELAELLLGLICPPRIRFCFRNYFRQVLPFLLEQRRVGALFSILESVISYRLIEFVLLLGSYLLVHELSYALWLFLLLLSLLVPIAHLISIFAQYMVQYFAFHVFVRLLRMIRIGSIKEGHVRILPIFAGK